MIRQVPRLICPCSGSRVMTASPVPIYRPPSWGCHSGVGNRSISTSPSSRTFSSMGPPGTSTGGTCRSSPNNLRQFCTESLMDVHSSIHDEWLNLRSELFALESIINPLGYPPISSIKKARPPSGIASAVWVIGPISLSRSAPKTSLSYPTYLTFLIQSRRSGIFVFPP